MTPAAPRLVIIGAGAVGGVTAAMVARSGHDVAVVARGPHLDAIRADGLRVRSGEIDETIRVEAHATVAEVDWRDGDLAVLAVKTQDTAAVLDQLALAVDPSTPVVCLQNAVANERMALRRFEHVYGVCVMCPTGHLRPGEVLASCAPTWAILDLGRWTGGTDETAHALAGIFRHAGAVSSPVPDIARWKHRKLVMNLGNAVQAICGRLDDDALEVVHRAQTEGEEVLEAVGIDVVPADVDRARRGDILQRAEIPGIEGRGGGSTHQSLARGTGHVETDWLNGEIALQARLIGRSAPVNALLQRTIRRLAADREPPGSMTGARLREMVVAL